MLTCLVLHLGRPQVINEILFKQNQKINKNHISLILRAFIRNGKVWQVRFVSDPEK